MGVVKGINFEDYPEQEKERYVYVGQRVKVCYEYDLSKYHLGIIVRDDKTEPFETIIKLDNGRYLRGTECQFQPVSKEDDIKSHFNDLDRFKTFLTEFEIKFKVSKNCYESNEIIIEILDSNNHADPKFKDNISIEFDKDGNFKNFYKYVGY